VATYYEIPTQPVNQEFDVSLAGVTYHLILTWCPPNNAWNMSIEDAQRNPLVSGIPLITGADLLEQFGYLGIGGSLIVQSDFDPDQVPDYGSLGSTGHLFFVTTP
jgi:hypothetical protein